VAALLIGAAAGPAAARSTAVDAAPAAGTATSALEILSLALANHTLKVGNLALVSDTVSGDPVSKVVVTPLTLDGTAYGEQTVTPASSPATVPVVDSSAVVPAALAGLAAVKSPAFDVSASNTDGASSKAGAASLGSVSVLGIPLSLDGTVDVSSLVDTSNALGEKNVTVKNVALPSIADLLAALGLDLPKLPIDTLTNLLKGLNLTSTAVATAQKALTDAQAASAAATAAAQKAVDDQQAVVNAATADLAAKVSALDAAKTTLATAQSTLAAAQAAVAALPLGAVVPANLTAAVTSAQASVTTAQTAVTAAQAAVDAAQKVLTDATTLLNSLLATLNGLLAQVAPQLDALLAAITGLLDGTPLVSIDSISIQTQALVTSAEEGGQTAKIVGGEVVGLHVLGTDVLNNVLGSSSVDVLDLVGSTLTSVNTAISGLTGTLSSVLSNVPSLPSLSIPAPQIGLFTKSTSTDIAGGFGLAQNSLKALTITIPAITLPAAVALPNAASLPAISGLPVSGALGTAAVGDLVSKPITLGLVTLSEQSKFHPAVTAAPGGATPPTATPETPNLATTGMPAGIALFAILLIGGALVLRRRLADGTEV
jgi:multidrug efflux pump subunit AcrA (membrane-fusion protein)